MFIGTSSGERYISSYKILEIFLNFLTISVLTLLGFIETYTPSEEINVASIQWSFKATEDVVKVEVWDVVDRGKARARPTGLKISSKASIPETPALDAEFLDVYKGTHGVILMMDITKNWTFEYVSKEISKIPAYIPVLLLG